MVSYSLCRCHFCLLSCYSLSISVLKFSSRWSAACTLQCCLQVQLALTSPGFIYLSVDAPVCACMRACVSMGCMGFCVLEIRLALACKVICLSPVSAVRSGKMILLNKIAWRLHTDTHTQTAHAHNGHYKWVLPRVLLFFSLTGLEINRTACTLSLWRVCLSLQCTVVHGPVLHCLLRDFFCTLPSNFLTFLPSQFNLSSPYLHRNINLVVV